VEERTERDEEARDGNMSDAQKSESVYTRIERIAEKARKEPELQFTSLAPADGEPRG
jgi:hypothetical protein